MTSLFSNGSAYLYLCLAPPPKYNSDKLEMVQRRAACFVKGRYGMFESVTQMLEQLTWILLSKRSENSRLILFYKIINNLAVVPHSCLEKADVHTRKKHSQKFRHISYNVDPYGQSFFPNCISAWNGLAKDFAEANTLDIVVNGGKHQSSTCLPSSEVQ